MPLPILVVEDDFANQRVASLFLQKLGFEVEVAENGTVGVELASSIPYQLIFMDCQMPLMDGFEASQRIRQHTGPNQKIPIIALTASVVYGIQDKCCEAGMNDVLNKPVDLVSMRAMLETWGSQPGR